MLSYFKSFVSFFEKGLKSRKCSKIKIYEFGCTAEYRNNIIKKNFYVRIKG